MTKLQIAAIEDATNFILANPFDVHIVEQKAKQILEALAKLSSMPLEEDDAEEIWDKYSRHIGDDIDSLQQVAGSVVMTERDFSEMTAKYFLILKDQQ